MESELKHLSDINHKIESCVTASEINTEELAIFVDKREQLLRTVIECIQLDPSVVDELQWHAAIAETQKVVALMQSKTAELGQALQKYRHGSKSVQQYKKFL